MEMFLNFIGDLIEFAIIGIVFMFAVVILGILRGSHKDDNSRY